VERFAIVARFRPEKSEQVKELLAAGPPFDLNEADVEAHAVYLSSREVVFVFEGRDVDSKLDDLADVFHPRLMAALDEWRELLEEDARLARPVYAWRRDADCE